jgi:hypothetical protein
MTQMQPLELITRRYQSPECLRTSANMNSKPPQSRPDQEWEDRRMAGRG